jgi:putative flavoprotein involved in K+ transport
MGRKAIPEQVDTVVVGGGQAGLAVGYYLAGLEKPFVILEAGDEVGWTWRARWDSLKLFTPSQYSNLPGLRFPGRADTYPSKDAVARYLQRYVETVRLPVQLRTRVTTMERASNGYSVITPSETFIATNVVIATGPFQQPVRPHVHGELSGDVFQIHSSSYRNPADLPSGEVLVVGGGNSGFQIADELSRTRKVYLSRGRKMLHLPQRLMGRDLFWWLTKSRVMDVDGESRTGRFFRSFPDAVVGTGVAHLRAQGVELRERVVAADRDLVSFADGRSLRVRNVIWATGFRRSYEWARVPVFDPAGLPAHTRGVTILPGLYFIGLPWQHTAGSALLGFVDADAAFIARRIAARGGQGG